MERVLAKLLWQQYLPVHVMGQALWERLAAQFTGDGTSNIEFFQVGPDGRRHARCLLDDTEPKVLTAG